MKKKPELVTWSLIETSFTTNSLPMPMPTDNATRMMMDEAVETTSRYQAFLENRQYVQYEVVVGSRGYGLHSDESDMDVHGWFATPTRQLLGLEVPVDNHQYKIHADIPQDVRLHEIAKFLRLALKGNPTAIESLYADEILTRTPLSQTLRNNRHWFTSQHISTAYYQYMRTQFNEAEKIIGGSMSGHSIPPDKRSTKPLSEGWKQLMHAFRLLIGLTHFHQTGNIMVHMGTHCDWLKQVRRGEIGLRELHSVYSTLMPQVDNITWSIPVHPDTGAVNRFLVDLRLKLLETS